MFDMFQLSNWINAPKIKNIYNPDIKIDIMQLEDDQGYILTVFEDLSEGKGNVLYRVPVECTLNNNWSLSTLEAIGMLNTLGFPCEWVDQPSMPQSATRLLELLQEFGWKTIVRSIRPVEVFVYDEAGESNAVSSIIPNFKYSDWKFLSVNIPQSIEGLLSNIKADPVDEEVTENISEEPTESE